MKWTHADNVVLMYAVSYISTPQRTSADLRPTPITLNDEDVAGLQPKALQLILSQFEPMQGGQIE